MFHMFFKKKKQLEAHLLPQSFNGPFIAFLRKQRFVRCRVYFLNHFYFQPVYVYVFVQSEKNSNSSFSSSAPKQLQQFAWPQVLYKPSCEHQPYQFQLNGKQLVRKCTHQQGNTVRSGDLLLLLTSERERRVRGLTAFHQGKLYMCVGGIDRWEFLSSSHSEASHGRFAQVRGYKPLLFMTGVKQEKLYLPQSHDSAIGHCQLHVTGNKITSYTHKKKGLNPHDKRQDQWASWPRCPQLYSISLFSTKEIKQKCFIFRDF